MEKQPDKQVDSKYASHSEQRKDGRGQNPESQANLKPFPKGISGNPSGKPVKNVKLREALRKYGYDVPRDIFGDKEALSQATNSMAVIDQIWEDAKNGKYQAIRLLIDYGAIEPEVLQPETDG